MKLLRPLDKLVDRIYMREEACDSQLSAIALTHSWIEG